jgi:hypothetical protein
MCKQWIVRAVVAVLLISALAVGGADAALAHPRQIGGSRTLTATPADLPNGYRYVMSLRNMITDNCLSDFAKLGSSYCYYFPQQQWGFTRDYTDAQGHEIGTLQNQSTGSCLDDSAVEGLRATSCHVDTMDPARRFQQFKLTYFPGDNAYQLQNMATGSCVDDSGLGLRGYFCQSGDYFQRWVRKLFT